MSKAILVMEMPKNCAECNLCGTQDGEYFCIPDDFAHYLGNSYVNHSCESKPDWCLLKPMPERETLPINTVCVSGYENGKREGWNIVKT